MRKTVLITGVSGGIGKELADRFAKDGQSACLEHFWKRIWTKR